MTRSAVREPIVWSVVVALPILGLGLAPIFDFPGTTVALLAVGLWLVILTGLFTVAADSREDAQVGDELAHHETENEDVAQANSLSVNESRWHEERTLLSELRRELERSRTLHLASVNTGKEVAKAASREALPRILELVPRVEAQLQSVAAQAEAGVAQTSQRLRQTYEQAKRHLAEVTSLSRQLQGAAGVGPGTEEQTFPTVTSVVGDLTKALRTLERQAVERSTPQYGAALKAILEQSATLNAVTLNIQHMADQANFLAMNAAIEDVRAGGGESHRSGPGHINELRQLSERSAEVSQDLQATARKIKDSVQRMAVAFGEQMTDGQQGSAFPSADVHKLITQVESILEALNQSAQAVGSGSEGMAHSIAQIILSLQTQDAVKQQLGLACVPLHQIVTLVEEQMRTDAPDDVYITRKAS